MFIEAAHALADQVTPAQLEQGLLFPPQSNILETEIKVAARVAKVVFDSNLARVARPDGLRGVHPQPRLQAGVSKSRVVEEPQGSQRGIRALRRLPEGGNECDGQL